MGGRLRTLKVRSTPRDPARAVHEGIVALLGSTRGVRLHYGSTVATNALLERRGARVVLLTTAGFEDVLEIGRQVRPELYALEPRRPAPLVPRALRIGLRERVLAGGRVEERLGAREIARAVALARRRRAQAVAVCFLHSWASPTHERLLGRALARAGLHVTLSHRLVREYREYERVATAVVNAYVGPVMAGHLRSLGPSAPGGLRVMQSSGGLIGSRVARDEPVRTVLSGPAGGVVGAAARAQRAGLARIITFDMGGTSADVSLVDGAPAWRTEARIGDLPIRVPAVDIHTVGAGGGSLARLDAGGALRVGPESAGADPGPACYGRGTAPTVTDANLVLGRLVETEFLGGTMRLDRTRAERALAPLARRLGWSLEATAAGIVRVANAVMERAVRVITVERGHDPRDFILAAFGGAGGLHAAELARALRIRRIYVPRDPGLLSAWGVLAAEVVRDYSQTLLAVAPPDHVLRAAFVLLERSARRDMRAEAVAHPTVERMLDVRYAGQSYELAVPFASGWVAAFHRRHAARFGHADPERPVEVVTLRLRARGGAGPRPATMARTATRQPPLMRRRVVFDGRAVATPVHRRDGLPVGTRLYGPLLICEYSATTVVPPGWRLSVEPTGGLLLEERRR